MLRFRQILVRDVAAHKDHRKRVWQLLRPAPTHQIHRKHLADLYLHRAHCGLTNHLGGGSLAHPKR